MADQEAAGESSSSPSLADPFPWHTMSVEACLEQLGLSSDDSKMFLTTGLSSEQAAQRLAQYGYNRMSEPFKVTLWQRLWKQLNNVLVWILTVVAIVAVVRACTSNTLETIVSNWIQVALIVFLIV
jgi:magnesium-transporting ATPase (P-type)